MFSLLQRTDADKHIGALSSFHEQGELFLGLE